MKNIRKPLIVTGASIMGIACAMGILAACMFTMTQSPPPILDAIGYISFWGFVPTGVVGAVVLIAGVLWKRPA